MWQRKQTIFLAITGASMLLMILFPIWMVSDGTTSYALFPLHYSVTAAGEKTTQYFPYSLTAVLAVAAATVAFFEIGKFKNRMLQIKLGLLNSLLMAGAMAGATYFASSLIKSNQLVGEYGLGLYLPGVALISNLVANRFIRKDEKLVRDSDRLR